MYRIEIDVPEIRNTDGHRLLEIVQQLVAVATHLGAGGAAAAQYYGRVASIGIWGGHLTHLHLLRIPIVAIQEAHNQAVHPTQCGYNGNRKQTMHHSESTQKRREDQAEAAKAHHGEHEKNTLLRRYHLTCAGGEHSNGSRVGKL